ncbi:hypothetical protein Mapa_008037 [Marchantia paleacea]|nr:hypothetical protein Mapa_008037 [Marchantia paleacea]
MQDMGYTLSTGRRAPLGLRQRGEERRGEGSQAKARQGERVVVLEYFSLTHSRNVVLGERTQSNDKVLRRQAGCTTAAAATVGACSSKFFPSPAG